MLMWNALTPLFEYSQMFMERCLTKILGVYKKRMKRLDDTVKKASTQELAPLPSPILSHSYCWHRVPRQGRRDVWNGMLTQGRTKRCCGETGLTIDLSIFTPLCNVSGEGEETKVHMKPRGRWG